MEIGSIVAAVAPLGTTERAARARDAAANNILSERLTIEMLVCFECQRISDCNGELIRQ